MNEDIHKEYHKPAVTHQNNSYEVKLVHSNEILPDDMCKSIGGACQWDLCKYLHFFM